MLELVAATCPFAPTLFYCLLNCATSYDPLGWGIPYGRCAAATATGKGQQGEVAPCVAAAGGGSGSRPVYAIYLACLSVAALLTRPPLPARRCSALSTDVEEALTNACLHVLVVLLDFAPTVDTTLLHEADLEQLQRDGVDPEAGVVVQVRRPSEEGRGEGS